MMEYKHQPEPEIKSVKERVIHGTGVRFGSPETKDWDGEFFVPTSEVGLDNGSSRPFLMEHGFSKNFGGVRVGNAVYEKNDTGWAYETTFLDNEIGNKAYQDVISHPYRSSAGAAGHTRRATIVKGASQLDIWMIAEQSATLTPADPENPRITRTKSDYILFAIQELLEDKAKSMKDYINEIVTKDNEARQALADVMSKFHESFSPSDENTEVVINEELFKAIEQVTQPIPPLNLG